MEQWRSLADGGGGAVVVSEEGRGFQAADDSDAGDRRHFLGFVKEALATDVVGELNLLAQLQIVTAHIIHDAATLEVTREIRRLPPHFTNVFALCVLQRQFLGANIQHDEAIGPRLVLLLGHFREHARKNALGRCTHCRRGGGLLSNEGGRIRLAGRNKIRWLFQGRGGRVRG
jgi:hypothetical protein